MAAAAVYYERKWAMPNSRTFAIKPIRRFIDKYTIHGGRTLDIFPYEGRRDAMEVMAAAPSASIDTALYDPVYSQKQQAEMYSGWKHSNAKNYANNSDYFKDVEREILRIVRPGGRCLKFMWNSKSLPGFDVIGGILVAHGSQHHDTICTAYERVQCRLTDGSAVPAALPDEGSWPRPPPSPEPRPACAPARSQGPRPHASRPI